MRDYRLLSPVLPRECDIPEGARNDDGCAPANGQGTLLTARVKVLRVLHRPEATAAGCSDIGWPAVSTHF